MLDENKSTDEDDSLSLEGTGVDAEDITKTPSVTGSVGVSVSGPNNGERDEYLRAIRHLDRLLAFNPSDPGTYFDKGFILEIIEKLEDAIKCFDHALKIKPNYFQALYRKGLVLSRLQNYVDAIKCFDQALEIKPNDINVLNN